jgi:hypothetical protein
MRTRMRTGLTTVGFAVDECDGCSRVFSISQGEGDEKRTEWLMSTMEEVRLEVVDERLVVNGSICELLRTRVECFRESCESL